MSYAQQNYSQVQGINGKYSIKSIGCFLTAFCNLEADYGNHIDPLGLNNFFVGNGGFIDVDDGIRDDLGWDSISRYDKGTRVTRTIDHGTNRTAGWPSSNQSIVRFYYKSVQTGQMIFHFCKVESASQQLILDSWDGQVKKSPYGEPTAWAEYVHEEAPKPAPVTPTIQVTPFNGIFTVNGNKWNLDQPNFDAIRDNPVASSPTQPVTFTAQLTRSDLPQYTYYLEDGNVHQGYNSLDCTPYTPPPTPYIPPLPPNKGTMAETYAVVTPLPYYDNAQIAYNKGKQLGTLQKGTYYVWNKEGSIYNVSTSNMKNEGKWINTQDNVAPVVVPVTTPSIDWKLTRSWFYPDRNKYDLYELQEDAVIRDLSGKGKEFLVFANKPNSSDNAMLKVHGTVSKDGTKYYLLHMPEDINWDNWYVIPMVNPHTRKAYLLKYADLYDTSVKKNQVSPGEEAIAALMSLGYKIFDVLSPRKVREWINKK